MADLAITTALTQIENALRDEVLLGLGKRFTVASVAALRALPSRAREHDELAFVTAAAFTYRFDRYSTAADNGTTVLRPDDVPTAGRWLRTASTSSTGYLKDVALYDGEPGEENILDVLFGRVPSVMVIWSGEEYEAKSLIPGALYRYRPRFELWGVSRNLRAEKQGATGSQIGSEATADPGVNRIIGDLRSVLAGSTLSSTSGVDYVEIVSADRVLSSKTVERGHVYRLAVEVRASIHAPSTDLVTLAAVRAFDVQRQLADLHGEPDHDKNNYLVSGIRISPVIAGLTQTVSAGSAYVAGTLVSFTLLVKVFTASRETYRDLNPNGTLTFIERHPGQPAPAVTTGALRIGVTISNATDVTEDRLLVSTLEDFGVVDQVPPT